MKPLLRVLLFAGLLFSPQLLAANGDITLFSSANTGGGQDYNVKIEILIMMTLLGLLPVMMLMMTCFTRFIIVLAILRQALGLQQSPPNKILTGIALALTLLVMRPVWTKIYDEAIVPFQNDEITMKQAFGKAETPLKNYMLAQTSNKAMAQMMDIAKVSGDPREQDLTVVTPAYLLSELKTAFQIGFMIYIPFLVIDLIVASILMAMGMMMLSPLIVSLPFKLMLFVLCDGWTLIVGTLTSSVQGL
ncbi:MULTISPECIES: flagellar type III secretion system pore protein FliP [Lelliottia]|jgi:flagellar biosynthetic protein FliP|uniref:Flagellar biosynthetic protein FliP n=1 Tax=Lelliottia aquatilis TaxID=2080838 RepID=A0ABX4ZY81_9ENTR|nr:MULTISPECIES: flagellar type III secretion system pore protein FliP [Lelliottia]ASV53636.1 Flagellar biosynthesis protein FliP [Lelliottia jeotgali]MBL5885821.1 flagellar type III secretion system pore protein FliP [Lelliottia aquatilis]NTZ47519.1 flagellar type III secretion system pore protein FliP [Lelliottia aquatilis]POZ15385.1 flagellar biosynthetic protein FliP [Lelliottia aquatilis]POZ16571.1 flagellar biosynthetic protein FliP [Lelliottia sp. 7254-16]